jgi:hypothetical protein
MFGRDWLWRRGLSQSVSLSLALVALIVPGCGSQAQSVDTTSTTQFVEVGTNRGEDAEFILEEKGNGVWEVQALVLENQDHGPQICTADIADSMPPLCGDIELTNWSWDAVTDEASIEETRWGTFHFVGEYEGEKFVVSGFLE